MEGFHRIELLGGELNDEIFFTMGDNCSHFRPFVAKTPIPTFATLTLTKTFILGESGLMVGNGWGDLNSAPSSEFIQMLPNISIGEFRMCHTPFGGVKTLVHAIYGWPIKPIIFNVLPKPSNDVLTFDIIKAPKIICYKDLFTATVAVSLVPEGLPT